ncbi:hypothetical protein H0H87_005442 [Tephrocybe sp. NHM501043]|nr:hypothetical protein H0H87_005442 [Tephrocybe sp. NHM501043]
MDDGKNGQSVAFSAQNPKSSESSQEDQEVIRPLSEGSSSSLDDIVIHPRQYNQVYMSSSNHPSPEMSQITLAPADSANSSRVGLFEPNGESTVRLVPPASGYPMLRVSSTRSGYSATSADTMIYHGSQADINSEKVAGSFQNDRVKNEGAHDIDAKPQELRVLYISGEKPDRTTQLLESLFYFAVQTMGYIVVDGKSNWLEGMILVCELSIRSILGYMIESSPLPTSLAECVA